MQILLTVVLKVSWKAKIEVVIREENQLITNVEKESVNGKTNKRDEETNNQVLAP